MDNFWFKKIYLSVTSKLLDVEHSTHRLLWIRNSTKDISLPSENDYKRKLLEKTEHLCKRMRWKAFFFLNPSADGSHKETFGFFSRK